MDSLITAAARALAAGDLFGALNTYKYVEKQSPGAYNILVMGPWFHGGWARGDGEGLGDVEHARQHPAGVPGRIPHQQPVLPYRRRSSPS